MYTKICQGHLLIVVFSGQVSTENYCTFAEDIERLVWEKGEIIVIALLHNPTQYSQSLREFITIFQTVSQAMWKITRFYTLHFNPLVSFISNVVSKAIGIHTRLVQRHSLEELFQIIEQDAERYPRLKDSMYDWEKLKTKLLSHALGEL